MFPKLIANYRLRGSYFLPWGNGPPVGQGLLIVEASRSHSDTTHSVGTLCTIYRAIPDKT